MNASEENMRQFMHTLDWFQSISGLSVNYEKTTVYRIGSLKNSNAKYYSERPLNWTSEGINVLGVDVRSSDTEAVKINYEKSAI